MTRTTVALRIDHVPNYLAEFEWRFNRRYDLHAMIARLASVAVRAPPTPNRPLAMAESHGLSSSSMCRFSSKRIHIVPPTMISRMTAVKATAIKNHVFFGEKLRCRK